MNKNLTILKPGILLLFVLLTGIVLPQQTDFSKERKQLKKFDATVSLNFNEAKLMDILRLLAAQHNLNLITGNDVKGEVTVTLQDVRLSTALDAILKVNGYDWFVQGNIVVVKPGDMEMAGELTTRIYKLNYVDASAVSTALTNVLTPKGKVQLFSPVLKGVELAMAGGGGQQQQGSGGGQQGSGGLLGMLGGGGSTGGVTGGASQQGPVGQGSNASGATGIGGLPTIDHLLVTDIFVNFDRIEDVINNLDIEIPQINIAVKFIETKLTEDESLGINWSARANMSILSGSSTTGDILNIGQWNSLNIASLSLPLFTNILEILATDGKTRLLQEPQVTTANNTMANVEVGTKIPILIPQPTGGLVGTQPFQFQEEEINIMLNVKPRINEDKFITLNIQATVQALVGYTGPDADRPIISNRQTQTQVTVNNGETLLIGGLIFDQLIETTTKIPILGSIPLIKKLFTNENKSTEQRELLIFITPNIVEKK